MARPTKYNRQALTTAQRYKRSNKSKKACVEALGITMQTWCNWVKRYPEFADMDSDWFHRWKWRTQEETLRLMGGRSVRVTKTSRPGAFTR